MRGGERGNDDITCARNLAVSMIGEKEGRKVVRAEEIMDKGLMLLEIP